MLSKCSDIDGEHIDSEGIEVEMVILTWMMRTIIWTTVHCIALTYLTKTSTLVCGGELALLGLNIKTFPIQ